MSLGIPVLVVSYAVLAISFWGWGMLAEHLVSTRPRMSPAALPRIWAGFSLILVLLEVIHFCRPITWIESTTLIGGGILLFLTFRPSSLHFGTSRLVPLGILLCAIHLAAQSLLPLSNSDSGLYHFQSIRWANEYPVVPGLGNLHGRLAFNQSFFNYVALLNIYPFSGRGHMLALSFPLLLFSADGIYALGRVLKRLSRKRSNISLPDVLSTLLLLFFVKDLFWQSLSSPAPDVMVALGQAVVFCYFLRLLQYRASTRAAHDVAPLVVILSATLTTLKLSNGPFSVILILCCWHVTRHTNHPRIQYQPIRAYYIALLIFAIHMATGLVLSGYPLYPSEIFALDVDWRIPSEQVTSMRRWIYSWARLPYGDPATVLASTAWFWPWFRSLFRDHRLILLLSTLSLGLTVGLMSFFNSRMQGIKTTRSYAFLAITMCPLIGALIVWFYTAPDIRFLGSLHVLFGLLPLCYSVCTLRAYANRGTTLLLSFALGLLVLWCGAKRNLYLQGFSAEPALVPTRPLVERVTKTGHTILLPAFGNECWNAALPCTPSVNSQLELRGATLGSGFRTSSNKSPSQ